MPELPEVEQASRVLRRVARGQVIEGVQVLHPAQRRALPAPHAVSLVGDGVVRVTRRGKHQLAHLVSGRTLVVHFRMTGDWEAIPRGAPPPRYTRLVLRFSGGRDVALVDPRALSVVHVVPAGAPLLPGLGPEATARAFNAAQLAAALGRRDGPVKPLLLDQSIVAGVGNIYAGEALWYARLDPRRQGHTLSAAECGRVVLAVKRVMRAALAAPARYTAPDVDHDRFRVYDREGAACRRCRTPIVRITQAGRSTWWCPACQR